MNLTAVLDDKVLEAEFRKQLAAAGVSRSSLPKRAYRSLLNDWRRGMRQAVLARLAKQA